MSYDSDTEVNGCWEELIGVKDNVLDEFDAKLEQYFENKKTDIDGVDQLDEPEVLGSVTYILTEYVSNLKEDSIVKMFGYKAMVDYLSDYDKANRRFTMNKEKLLAYVGSSLNKLFEILESKSN